MAGDSGRRCSPVFPLYPLWALYGALPAFCQASKTAGSPRADLARPFQSGPKAAAVDFNDVAPVHCHGEIPSARTHSARIPTPSRYGRAAASMTCPPTPPGRCVPSTRLCAPSVRHERPSNEAFAAVASAARPAGTMRRAYRRAAGARWHHGCGLALDDGQHPVFQLPPITARQAMRWPSRRRSPRRS